MTVEQLKAELNRYDDDMEIKVVMDSRTRRLDKVKYGVDIDTNLVYLWLCGDEVN